MPGGKIDILVEPDTKGFASKLGAGLRAASSVASAAGKAIGLAVTAGSVAAAAGLKQVVDLGIQYQNSLNTFQAVTGATAEQMAQVGARAKELGSDLTLPATSAVDAAAAMTELAKGGLTVDQAMTAAKGTLQLAAAAQIDAAQAAGIQSNALNTFNLSADQAGHVADVLANAANAASGEITDFAQAFQSGGAVAAQFGISIDDTATALGLLANRGIQGSDAGTLLKSTLLALTDTGKPAQAAIKQLGLTVYDSQGKFVGLKSLFEQLNAASKRMTQEQYAAATATLFGSDAVRLAGVAANTTSAQWDQMSAAITKSGGAAEVAAAKTKGVGGAIEGIKSQLETISLTVFSTFAQPLEDGLRTVGEVLDVASDKLAAFVAGGGIQKLITDAGDKIRIFAASWGITWDGVVQFVETAWTRISTIAGNVGTALAPIATGIVTVLQSLRTSGVLDGIVTGFGLLADAAVALSGFLVPVGKVIGDLLGYFAELPGPIQGAVLAFLAFRGMPALADSLGTSVGRLVTTSGPLGEVLGGAIDGIIGGFQKVGEVSKGSLGGIRTFLDEMKVQSALAEASGESISKWEAAAAAAETTSVGWIAESRDLVKSFQDIQAGAAASGEDISNVEAAIRALGEHSQTIGDLVSSFDAGAAAGQALGDSIQSVAVGAAEALSGSLISATNKVADGIRALPGIVAAAGSAVGSALADGARAGVDALQAIPGAAAAAAQAVAGGVVLAAQGLGDAFQGAADFVSEFGGQIQEALAGVNFGAIKSALSGFVSTVRTGFTSAVTAARAFAVQMGTAVGAAFSNLGARAAAGLAALRAQMSAAFTGMVAQATAAMAAMRAALSGLTLSGVLTGLRTSVVAAGTAIRTGLTATLTGLRTGITAMGTALQAGLIAGFRAIPGAVSGATGALTGLLRTAAGVGATLGTTLLKGVGGLVNILGGPLGVALLAAQFGLQALAQSQQEAAAAAQEHQQKLEALAGTLDAYSGAVTQATIDEKAGQLAKDGTLKKVQELGISTRDYTLASLGNADALARVKAQLDAHTRGLIESSAAYKDAQPQLKAMGLTIEDLTQAASGSQPALDKIAAAIKSIPDADARMQMQALVDGILKTGEASAQLAADLGISNGELQKIQDQMRLASEASANFERVLGFFKPAFGALKDGAAVTTEMANGFRTMAQTANDAAMEAGRSAQQVTGSIQAGGAAAFDSMQKARDAFIQAATSAGVAAPEAERLANAIGLIPSAAKINFETNATGVQAELNTLSEIVKTVPDAKSITVNMLSADAETKLESIGLRVERLPNGQVVIKGQDDATPVIDGILAATAGKQADIPVTAHDAGGVLVGNLIAGTIQNLFPSMGVTAHDQGADSQGNIIRDLISGKIPDMGVTSHDQSATSNAQGYKGIIDGMLGDMGVTSHDAGALQEAERIRSIINGMSAAIKIIANPVTGIGGLVGAQGGVVRAMHDGGVVGYANGALSGKRLTPMRGGIASIVHPNTWRVIGDRVRDDEAYIPLNQSARSKRILQVAADRMGYDLAKRFAAGGVATSQARTVAARQALRTTGGDMAVVSEIQQLRRDVTSLQRRVEITNQFFTEPSARDSDTVAKVQRRQAALGLFAG